MGLAYYFQGDYEMRWKSLLPCRPCRPEMAIALIYWHSLASLKAEKDPSLCIVKWLKKRSAITIPTGRCFFLKGELTEESSKNELKRSLAI